MWEIGVELISGVSVLMVASRGESDATIISNALENGVRERMAPVQVAIKRGLGFFGQGRGRDVSALVIALRKNTDGAIVFGIVKIWDI